MKMAEWLLYHDYCPTKSIAPSRMETRPAPNAGSNPRLESAPTRLLTDQVRPRAKLVDQEPARDKAPFSALASLPTEIILLIFDQLPLPTQACLALTCRILYQDLGYILKDDRLSGPTAWTCKTVEVPLTQPTLLRNQFLFNFQDDRWVYCAGCLKIHPRCVFRDFQLSSPYAQRRDHGDVVDLCPCIALTLFEAQQLKKWIQTLDTDKIILHERNRRAFMPVMTVNGQLTLLHRCSITDHAEASVELAVTVSIEKTPFGLLLELRSSYHFHFNFDRAAFDNVKRSYERRSAIGQLEPIFSCPHTNILWLIFGWNSLKPYTCEHCSTKAEITALIDDELNVTVQSMRSLGRLEYAWPSEWAAICRHEGQEGYRRWYNNAGESGYPSYLSDSDDLGDLGDLSDLSDSQL